MSESRATDTRPDERVPSCTRDDHDNCVEVGTGVVGVRDTKENGAPDQPKLVVDNAAFAAFLRRVA